jgi:cell division protease FtsH
MNSTSKVILFWISMVFLSALVWTLVSTNGQSARQDEPTYSEFMKKVDSGDVRDVTIYLSSNSYELQGEYSRPANRKFHVSIFKEAAPDVTKELTDKGVQIQIKVKDVRSADWVLIVLNSLPLLLLAGFCLFLMRQLQAGATKALSFGQSPARLLSAQQTQATFKDVVGNDETRQESQPTVAHPQRAVAVGAATVHVTSSTNGGDIYVDGKFYGNTPSDITLAAGEHVINVATGGKQWSRTVQITAGEIRLHAEISDR